MELQSLFSEIFEVRYCQGSPEKQIQQDSERERERGSRNEGEGTEYLVYRIGHAVMEAEKFLDLTSAG